MNKSGVERVRAYNPISGPSIQDRHELMPIPYSEIERNTEAVLEKILDIINLFRLFFKIWIPAVILRNPDFSMLICYVPIKCRVVVFFAYIHSIKLNI